MKKGLIAALVGVGAGAVLLGAYAGLLYAGIQVRPEFVMAGTAALAFAGTVAVFSLLAMDKAHAPGSPMPILMNEVPATHFIFAFTGKSLMQVTARPEQSVGEILVRYADLFKGAPSDVEKEFVLTIKGSRRTSFDITRVQQLFGTLKPFKVAHVILMADGDEFVGYIPGKRAIKEFTGDDSATKIDKYILKVLVSPSLSGVLRELGGVAQTDVVSDADTAASAQAKVWANESIQGFVVHHHLKPAGFISKVDVLKLNAVRG